MTRKSFLSMAAVGVGMGGLSLVSTAEAQPTLTRKTIKAAIENAKAPQDHQRIAAYYKAEANRLLEEAKEHDELATAYARAGNVHSAKHPMSGQTAEHCKHFAEAARKAAQASQDLAKAHGEMAKPTK
jgi:hypothetical protein